MLGKTRTVTLVAAVVVTASMALVHQATASHQATHKAFSGGATFKGLVVKTESAETNVTASLPTFQLIDSRGFQIPAGDSQLVVVDFFAETFCDGTSGTCMARVLIGRTLGTAQVAEPAGNTVLDQAPHEGVESHAISQALCVRNATASPFDISVFVEASKSSSGAGFTIRKYTLKIARNSTCTPSVDI